MDDRRIDDYLAGRLEANECEEFEAQAADDPKLRQILIMRAAENLPAPAPEWQAEALTRGLAAARRTSRPAWLLPLAAALLIASGVFLLKPSRPLRVDEILRSPEGGHGPIEIRAPAAGALLNAGSIEVDFVEVPGVFAYRVVAIDGNGNEVAATSGTGPPLLLDLRDRNGTLFFFVEASRPEGKLTSEIQRLDLSR